MEEHADQKMNTLKVLNANLDEALAKKDYTLAATIQRELHRMEEQ